MTKRDQQWIEPHELERRWFELGREKEDYPVSLRNAVGARISEIADDWVQFEIYELVNGRRVVVEVRVFPIPPGQFATSGVHKVHMFGERSPEDVVPHGGVTARLMHKTKIGHIHAEEVVVDYRKSLQEWFGADAVMRFDEVIGQPPRRRGGPALPDSYYADIAVQYEKLGVTGNKSPIKYLAEVRGVSDAKMRSDIHRARQKGFLEPATKWGTPGGTATGKAHQLLGDLDETISKKKGTK